MKRSALKDDARDKLMHGLQASISSISDVNQNAYSDELRKEMIKQFRRVEKLFGYVPGSWSPFC